MARKKKRKKLKLLRVLLVLFFLAILVIIVMFAVKIPVRGYYISGNTYYTDEEILTKTSLNKYPSYLLTTSFSVNSKIKDDKLIEKIKVKKTLSGRFKVIVYENKILFYDSSLNKSILSNGEKVDYFYHYSPVLINKVSDNKVYKNFLTKLQKINDDIIKNISEIKYDPNEIDKERFLLSMNDGNYVYLTLSKFSNINNYLEISKTLGDKNGILYLDYGNYFVPKE
ncbi:MAG: FtsQ-type POTRA domain-containing protein [Bacilli bacterium]|nr:FtsQ-type POTRA domain-containing protein [Bacilli bacterium]MBP3635308.1 FtsQ-type POTRA domain-containing protein [Bacilli bacterium]